MLIPALTHIKILIPMKRQVEIQEDKIATWLSPSENFPPQSPHERTIVLPPS